MSDVADIRSRYRFFPDSLVKYAEVMGLQLDADAPKHFTFDQRFETCRVRDGRGFFVREKDRNGCASLEDRTQALRGGVAAHWSGRNQPAKEWAIGFADTYGFEPKYLPSGAEKTRQRPRATVLPFRTGDDES